MSKSRILLQLDTDRQPSSFDSVVAIDSGVDHLLTYANVNASELESLVHGTMFTRGGSDLAQTAIFFGGSDVAKTEELVAQAKQCFFGEVRVSIMADPNGSNTTAVAAVLCAENHIELRDRVVTVLAGTGPVGLRIAQLAFRCGARVRVCSRRLNRAEEACSFIRNRFSNDNSADLDLSELESFEVVDSHTALESIAGADVVFSAGAAGVELLDGGWLDLRPTPLVAIDINAVEPVGIVGIKPFDKGEKRGSAICYGAIGVGGLKMKIHKRCLKQLFESNDQVLDTTSIYELGKTV